MIHTLILDLDGPLLDGRLRHYTCYCRILERHGYAPLDVETYWQMKRARVNRHQQLAASEAGAIYDQFLREWMETIEEPELLALDRVQPGALETLRDWKRQERRLVLATARNHAPSLQAQLETVGLADLLDEVVVTSHSEGGAGKARQVERAIGDGQAAHSLWIGDTEMDVEAARAFGCPIWALSCGLRTADYLRSLAPDFLSAQITQVDLSLVPIKAL